MRKGVSKFLGSLIILLILTCELSAQDIHFSQFYETPLLRNPALAGIFSGDVRLQSVYRTQWGSVTVPYQTGSLNGEYKLPLGGDNFVTIGGQILYDKAGTINLTTTHILPALNFHKSLSGYRNTFVSLGFMGGLVQRNFDRSKVTTDQQFNGGIYTDYAPDGENFTKTSYSYFDGSVGMSFNTQIGETVNDNMFLGIAYHHFNRQRGVAFYDGTFNQIILF
ncbi:MAG: PorP/SprF family type IX secretion system membrane protein [Sphingobacteriales bacterium]|nr:PorP/SprF family type IX secretion system membrane protein [Sphingobacteriales bacterium]